jgi:hypothetical protein
VTDLGAIGHKLDPKWQRALREMVAPDRAETAEEAVAGQPPPGW